MLETHEPRSVRLCASRVVRPPVGAQGYLIHRLGDPPLAEDLLQEVFIKAMREGEKFCALANTRAWLFQVARNTLALHSALC
ncbi:MAG TPA: sigma factor [Casimicrobiaceae bacterium]